MPVVLAGVWWVPCLALLATTLPAQEPAQDPYTRGDPEVMEKLGYRSWGPFPLADGHGSQEVDALVGGGRMRWVETGHFRIGTDLATRPLPDDNLGRRSIYAECRRLQRRHGTFPATPTKLDGWLQLHLMAQRMEDLLADLQRRAGVDDRFADHAEGAVGPHFGCRDKFVLLVFEAESELIRYLRTHTHCREDRAWLQHFPATDCFLFATAAQAFGGELRDPFLLHGHVVHAMVQNLLEAFVGVGRCPFWLQEGLAHWYTRRIDPRLVEFTNLPMEQAHRFTNWEWEARLRARARQDLLPALADMLTWYDGRNRGLIDHAAIWSLVDWMMAQEPTAVATCLQSCRREPLTTRYLSRSQVLEWHTLRLDAAFGCDLPQLDERWRKHIATRLGR